MLNDLRISRILRGELTDNEKKHCFLKQQLKLS